MVGTRERLWIYDHIRDRNAVLPVRAQVFADLRVNPGHRTKGPDVEILLLSEHGHNNPINVFRA